MMSSEPPRAAASSVAATLDAVPPPHTVEPSGLRFLGRALRSRNYRLVFAGQLVSLIGSWMTSVATSWLVYRLTGSELLLGKFL